VLFGGDDNVHSQALSDTWTYGAAPPPPRCFVDRPQAEAAKARSGPERVLPSYNATPSVSHRHRNIARRGIWFERIDLFLTKEVLVDQSPIGAPLRSNTEVVANKCAFQHTRVGRSRLCFVCNAAEL
jgi:hypothetical protein